MGCHPASHLPHPLPLPACPLPTSLLPASCPASCFLLPASCFLLPASCFLLHFILTLSSQLTAHCALATAHSSQLTAHVAAARRGGTVFPVSAERRGAGDAWRRMSGQDLEVGRMRGSADRVPGGEHGCWDGRAPEEGGGSWRRAGGWTVGTWPWAVCSKRASGGDGQPAGEAEAARPAPGTRDSGAASVRLGGV